MPNTNAGTEALLRQVLSRLDKLQTDVTELKSDVSILKTDVSELKTDVSKLKNDMTSVKSHIKHTSDMQEAKWTHELIARLPRTLVTFRAIVFPWRMVFRLDGSDLTDLDGVFLYGNTGLAANARVRQRTGHTADFHLNLNVDNSIVSLFQRQVLYILEGKNYVDKVHIDTKMMQMLEIRNMLVELNTIRSLNAVTRLPNKIFHRKWKAMIREHKYLLRINTDRLRLFFGVSFIEPTMKRYIETIHKGMTQAEYENLSFALARQTKEYETMFNNTRFIHDYDSLRSKIISAEHKSVDHARLLAILRPFSEIKTSLEYFKDHIGYLDEKTDFGIPLPVR